jgi:hypothetical protein
MTLANSTKHKSDGDDKGNQEDSKGKIETQKITKQGKMKRREKQH